MTTSKNPGSSNTVVDERVTRSVPGQGRSSGGAHGNPSPVFLLEKPVDRGDWQATFHRVAAVGIRLKQLSMFDRGWSTI